MFNLIRYGICHPKFLGSYMVDKTYKIVLVLVGMFIILASTIFGLNVNQTYLTTEEATIIRNVLVQKTEVNYENYKLTFKDEIAEDILGFRVILDNDGIVEKDNLKDMNIILSNDKVSISVMGYDIASKKYSEFNNYNFNLNNESSMKDNIQFGGFIEEALSISYSFIYLRLTLMDVMEVIFSGMLLFLFIFLMTGRMNTQVKGKMRIKLLLSCFISYFFIYWFYFILERNTFLYLLTYVIPYLYFVVALGNILRIAKVVK